MNCPSCETENRASARFCDSCGASLGTGGATLDVAHAYRRELEGDLEGAIALYEGLLAEHHGAGSAIVRKHLGNLHFRMGHLRRAKEHLTRACELDATNGSLWHDLGVIQYHMADFDGAVDCFEQALSSGQGNELSYYWLGNAQYHRGGFKDAEGSFKHLIDRFPSFNIARFQLAVIYARQGERERARDEFRRVLIANPDDAAARYYVSS